MTSEDLKETVRAPQYSYSRRVIRAFLRSQRIVVEVVLPKGETPRRLYKRLWMFIHNQDRKGVELSKRVKVLMRGDRVFLMDPEVRQTEPEPGFGPDLGPRILQ